MRADALERGDRARPAPPACGRSPSCATAGTTTTGSIDPLPAIAAIAAGARALAPRRRRVRRRRRARPTSCAALLAGVERADSIAVDPHKWLYTSQSAGCVLLRDFGALSRSFHSDASYIWLDEAARHGVDFAMHGPQFSRGFAALKVWVSLLAHGRAAYGRRIAHDVALARYLGELVEEHPDFELMCRAAALDLLLPLPPAGWDGSEEELDRAQRAADDRDPWPTAACYCSNAVIDGRFGLRACIVNFRTEAEDVERLLAVAAELGARG